MSTQNNKRKLDDIGPTFDPGLDIATEMFSHVQCVKTRVNLAVMSRRIWRDAFKPAAAYPLEFDFGAFPDVGLHTRSTIIIRQLDNDEALSLPYERVVGLLGEPAEPWERHPSRFSVTRVCNYAASRGSVRLLKWARENNRAWSTQTCRYAAQNGHLSVLKYLHENGCPWDRHSCSSAAGKGHLPVLKYLHETGCPWDLGTCLHAAHNKQWDCLQYAVDNKAPEWEEYAKKYAKHLR